MSDEIKHLVSQYGKRSYEMGKGYEDAGDTAPIRAKIEAALDQQAARIATLEAEVAKLRAALETIAFNTRGKFPAAHQMEFTLQMVNATAKDALGEDAAK